MRPENTAAQKLTSLGRTLAVAESCSGGLLSNRMTNIPGSSAFFQAGVVAYSYASKVRLLGIPWTVLNKHGAVSREVVTRMARNVRRIGKADFGIGITGIAGPGGATARKPVGLVYIAAASAKKLTVKRCLFKGTREQVKEQTVRQAIQMLLALLP